jgi:hypothetical protein
LFVHVKSRKANEGNMPGKMNINLPAAGHQKHLMIREGSSDFDTAE